MTDRNRGERPKQDIGEIASNAVRIWVEMAACASDIAHAKRAIFLAYVAEGFNETQALELVKQL